MDDMTLFYTMTLVVPILILWGLHIMWQREWSNSRSYTLTIRIIGWIYSLGTIGLWALFAR